MSKEKWCGNCSREGHKTIDCPIIDLQFPPTKKDYEKLKEDANSYQNWLKFVAGRGLTDVLVEPLKVKEKFDKLKKEIRYLQELNNGLNAACDALKQRRKLDQTTHEKATKQLNELQESYNIKVKGMVSVIKNETKLQQKLEKIKEFANKHEKSELEIGYATLQECAEAGTDDAWWIILLKEILK